MSADDDRMSVEEAAEFLRDLRDNVGRDQLTETFQTGGGLMDHEESGLVEAIEVVGTDRAADILGVDVPDDGVPGEQAALPGMDRFGRESEEAAEPPPRGQEATLSGFADGPSRDVFTDEERGRIRHFAEMNNLGSLLITLDLAGPMIKRSIEAEIDDVDELVEWWETRRDFTDIEGIGPARSQRLEAAAEFIDAEANRRGGQGNG